MPVYVVIDLTYGDEGNGGVMVFKSRASADKEKTRLERLKSKMPEQKAENYLVCEVMEVELKD